MAENYRFEPAFDRAAEVLASGSLGTLTGGRLVAATPMGPDNKYVCTPWRGSTTASSTAQLQLEQMQQAPGSKEAGTQRRRQGSAAMSAAARPAANYDDYTADGGAPPMFEVHALQCFADGLAHTLLREEYC